eukprot:TRINITY_DN3534_c0_g1_i6.p2 TRINITY_DN3534_c0_g1~~TRINITY_DN3534_c0_g1_i6.p2  ORF type:complete len:130 (-),score=49.59 TRINITY_DN3534_c0_g1_i6:680-1069(-)
MLYRAAALNSGYSVEDPTDFASMLVRVASQALGVDPNAKPTVVALEKVAEEKEGEEEGEKKEEEGEKEEGKGETEEDVVQRARKREEERRKRREERKQRQRQQRAPTGKSMEDAIPIEVGQSTSGKIEH